MLIEATQDQIGSGYRVRAGQLFEVPADEAQELLANGFARRPQPPRVVYQTKVIQPAAPEVVAAQPFRVVHHADAQSAAVHRAGGAVLAGADVRASGTAGGGRRGGRN